jgi:hypothetical protein
MVKRRHDGRFDLSLDSGLRAVLAQLLGELRGAIDDDPHHPDLARLQPTAYADDPDRDAEYQLLAGEELRESRRGAIDAVVVSLERDVLDEDELWAWLRATNALRLLVGTRLGITEDDEPLHDRSTLSDDEQHLWSVYDFTTLVQYEVVEALS